jgi:hypothetical protein
MQQMIGVLRRWINDIRGISTTDLTPAKFTIAFYVITSVISWWDVPGQSLSGLPMTLPTAGHPLSIHPAGHTSPPVSCVALCGVSSGVQAPSFNAGLARRFFACAQRHAPA